jgi:endonuclease G
MRRFAFVFGVVLVLLFNCGSVSVNTRAYRPTGIEIPAALKNTPEMFLYRKAYIVSYNKKIKLPNWVAWHLTAAHADGVAKRPGNAFHEDEEVPVPRATLADYKGSGYDRGHMCPAGDNKWNSEAMYESFLLSNMCPQYKSMNEGVWNDIESSCRVWAKKYGNIYIVTGPIFFRQEHKRIGPGKLLVPEAFYKVVLYYNGAKSKGIGFICRNTETKRNKDLYVNSIDQVERVTGMDFFPSLPDNIEIMVEKQRDIANW